MSLPEGKVLIEMFYQGERIFATRSEYVPSVDDMILINEKLYSVIFRTWIYKTEHPYDSYKAVRIALSPVNE